MFSSNNDRVDITTNKAKVSAGINNFRSPYEQLRINNIIRNNAKLRQLGLISLSEEKKSNLLAQGGNELMLEQGDDDDNCVDDIGYNKNIYDKKYKKRKRKTSSSSSAVKVPIQGSRKSLRLQGIKADSTKNDRSETDIIQEREERVKECREARLRAAKAIADAGAENAGKANPTATYEHCLMRVKSMSDKKLANRVKVIERAAGIHCVVKMAIFKSCLQDEGKWDLAELASEALERLKSLKAPE